MVCNNTIANFETTSFVKVVVLPTSDRNKRIVSTPLCPLSQLA
jgi:hypothetical protein